MQSADGRRPDLNASDSICHLDAPKYECFLNTRIDADDGSWTDIDFRVKCTLDPVVAFDFRRSQECGCLAYMEHSDPNRPPKTCSCSICPINFGRSPIAIDCEATDLGVADSRSGARDLEGRELFSLGSVDDPFIIAGCSSLDCGFACNGTCAFDCTQSGPECEFCAPTAAPTFQGVGSSATRLTLASCVGAFLAALVLL